ncbi:ribosomal protein S18-alanine N-acetyltransferase [Dehalogenimonas sp. 4OHTPN]|uniref:Ribosomal protein S18-alanine N-acetyltransferase n=1 Tax=Dehalogenimonas sp. 4OHTPN TaxID=3166643 RepID=A0AAU8GA69_9CHLR
MLYKVRPMSRDDVTQVTAIDREAFPTMWPPINYHRELENQMAFYIVAVYSPPQGNGTMVFPPDPKPFNWLKNKLSRHDVTGPVETIAGFAGFWMMAGEAHIISLAVKKEHRRRGLGNLLLVNVVIEAIQRDAEIVTLEVRTSNFEAQNLYFKHGFISKGVRRAYYTDNREDALIMTLDNVNSQDCSQRFDSARRALETVF